MALWLFAAWLTAAPLSGEVPVTSAAVFCADGSLAFLGGPADAPTWFRATPGSPPHPLVLDPPVDDPQQAWWSPGGDQLAYLATVDDRLTLQVWRPGAEAARLFAVVDESPRPGFRPLVAWTRDGQRLAFSRANPAGAAQPYAIVVLGADGSGPLHELQLPAPPTALRWDFGGGRLVHLARPGGDGRTTLVVSSLTTARVVNVTPGLLVQAPTLSFTPDGRRLLFGATGEPERGWRLFSTRADGQLQPTRLAHDGYLPGVPLTWSADGRWLAFCAGSLSRPTRGRLVLASADDLSQPQAVLRDRPWLTDPAFSPDGRWLALTSHGASIGRESEVVLLPLDNPARPVVLSAPANAAQPVFSPTSDQLAVTADVAGRRSLLLLPVPVAE